MFMRKGSYTLSYTPILSVVVTLWFALVFCEAAAQENCETKSQIAEEAYQAGNIRRVISLLEGCASTQFLSRTKTIEALSLLTRAYLVLDQKKQAIHCLVEILRLDPEYKVPVGEMEMLYLFHSIRTRPVAYRTIRLGTNLSYVDFLQKEISGGLGQKTLLSQEGINPSFSVAASINFRILKGLELGFEAGYQEYNWARKTEITSLTPQNGKPEANNAIPNAFHFVTITNTERLKAAEGALLLRYRWNHFPNSSGPRPYIYAGIGGQGLISSTINTINRQTLQSTDEVKPEVQGSAIPTFRTNQSDNLRTAYNWSLMGGLGLSYKFSRSYLSLDARYTQFWDSSADLSQRYTASQAQELLFTYAYLDEAFRLGSLTLSLEWTVPLYNPKLLKHSR